MTMIDIDPATTMRRRGPLAGFAVRRQTRVLLAGRLSVPGRFPARRTAPRSWLIAATMKIRKDAAPIRARVPHAEDSVQEGGHQLKDALRVKEARNETRTWIQRGPLPQAGRAPRCPGETSAMLG
jgi:hypothetical protein